MSEIYTINPVISNDNQLRDIYNASLKSSLLVSECMSESEFSSLLEHGLKLGNVILVNNDGLEIANMLGEALNWDEEQMPNIKPIYTDDNMEEALGSIHEIIERDYLKCGMG
jgi:hypothetical protein